MYEARRAGSKKKNEIDVHHYLSIVYLKHVPLIRFTVLSYTPENYL